MSIESYKQLCREDLEWLLKTKRTLERDHVQQILEWHIAHAQHILKLAEELSPQVSK